MTINSMDYALLAQDSYKDREPKKEFVLGGVNYRTLDHADSPITGFQATAYQRVDTGEVVIAFRGTEFDREPAHDGIVDTAMALAGVNAQAADAKAFTARVLTQVNADSHEVGKTLRVTVTGHSLGGTLAELQAHNFGLKGETFNAYGAAGLLHGVPEGGHQVVNHVRAGDVVSAASAHFGEVRIYAAQQDIDTLSKAGYRDDGGAWSTRNPVKATDFSAHSIDNFVPHGETLGHSIIAPENEARYRAHHSMVDRYRNDIHNARAVASVPLQTGMQAGQTFGYGVKAVGHAAGQAYDAACDKVETGARRAGEALERAGEALREGSFRIIDKAAHPGAWFRSSMTGPTPILNRPEHPGHGLYQQSLAGMEKINAEREIPSDERTCNAAGTLAAAACRSGLRQIDHVALSDNGHKLIAVQGTPGSVHSKVVDVPTVQALSTPLEDSSMGYLQAMHRAASQQTAQQARDQPQLQPTPSV